MDVERFLWDGSAEAEFRLVRGLPELPPELPERDVECRLARAGGRPVARLSLSVHEGLHGAAGRSGLIGHYEALERACGAALLRTACAELESRGVARVLGPMNGSTWRRYRLALPAERGDAEFDPPWFSGEPRNPFDYPDHFADAGFRMASRFESRADDLADEAPDTGEVARRVATGGFTLRPLELERFDAELDLLHRLSLEAFAGNPYYVPIDAGAFRALYEPLRPIMDPEYVRVALDGDRRPCGYLFAFADPASITAGRPARVIAKTVAVAPGARGHGIANHMLDRIRQAARRRGCREMIHALMHVDNFSTRMSARQGGRLFRRYALMEWTP